MKKNTSGKVLFLEDEDLARNSVTSYLNRSNFDIFDFEEGQQAIDHATPDIELFLLDIQMDPPDGIDVATELQDLFPQTPIVFLTSHAGKKAYQSRIKQNNVRVADWVSKPFNSKELIKVLNKELEKGRIVRGLVNEALSLGLSQDGLISILMSTQRALDSFTIDDLLEELNDGFSIPTEFSNISSDPDFLAYLMHKDELKQKYQGEYLAFLDGELVGHHKNWDKLIEKVFKKTKRIDIFTVRANMEEIEVLGPSIDLNKEA